jgi:hypothetical protein
MSLIPLVEEKSSALKYNEDEIKQYAPELLKLLRGYSDTFVSMTEPSFPFTCDLTLGFDLHDLYARNADAAMVFGPVCGSLLIGLAINLRNTVVNGDSIISLYSDDEWEELDPKALVKWEDDYNMVTVKPILRIQADDIEAVKTLSKQAIQTILPLLRALIGRLVVTRTVEATLPTGIQAFAPDTANSWIEL